MKRNITPIDIAEFFQLLDDCLNVQIEEAKGMDSFTLEDVKQVNRGNNCLHTELFCDKSRIEIQTYKELSRKGEVCVMQGKVDSCDTFQDIVDFINSHNIADSQLNNLFVLYSWYSSCCSVWIAEMDDICWEFFNDVLCWYDSAREWTITTNSHVSFRDMKNIIWFINQINDICKG